MKCPINREYPLYADEYSFEIDQNNNFRLTQLKDDKSMLLGIIVEKPIWITLIAIFIK
ncbi:hypothetical protein [[Muricauda] lutisoli]|uniref:Uncharacterized protein n=1 Tax=[Muricauda] lutisoli TaxID=2816035 RepID=A0ABS3EUK0_9FLAO|nr:hypothetical protein [[Muricauda] lutisoli]MBO0329928.1 hypothetical protein [[Muricauda] lutisoli]